MPDVPPEVVKALEEEVEMEAGFATGFENPLFGEGREAQDVEASSAPQPMPDVPPEVIKALEEEVEMGEPPSPASEEA